MAFKKIKIDSSLKNKSTNDSLKISSPDFILDKNCPKLLKKLTTQNNSNPQDLINKLANNYTGHTLLTNFFIDLLSISGIPQDKIKKMALKKVSKVIVSKFDDKALKNSLSNLKTAPKWSKDLLMQSVYRKMIFELSDKYKNNFFVEFCLATLNSMGFNKLNSDLDFDMSLCNDEQKLKDTINNLFSKISKKQLKTIWNLHPSKLVTFLKKNNSFKRLFDLSCFSKSVFKTVSQFLLSPPSICISAIKARIETLNLNIKPEKFLLKFSHLLTFYKSSKGTSFYDCCQTIFPKFFNNINEEQREMIKIITENNIIPIKSITLYKNLLNCNNPPPCYILGNPHIILNTLKMLFNGNKSEKIVKNEKIENEKKIIFDFVAFCSCSKDKYFFEDFEHFKEFNVIIDKAKESEVREKLEEIFKMVCLKDFLLEINKYEEDLLSFVDVSVEINSIINK